MQSITKVVERQLWNLPTETTTGTEHCTAFTLPSNGVLSFGSANLVTLTSDVVFSPQCTGEYKTDSSSTHADASPFYASSTPQVYVLSAATVLAWVLVTMLIISPRSFFRGIGGSPSSAGLGGRGVIGGANGGSSSVGWGTRPWLQKAAALTVAVALTIATADTFKVTERHYPAGIDGNSLREEVENSLEIRITRVVSDIFVWLAQVQTLIRLFPRHKEKVLIKWIGFVLIILDTTFSCLNSFEDDSTRRPRDFVDAIPALAYLFELALGLLYAAWVLYYAATKRRYAFYHPRMKNICLIALLSILSILTPVVFFVTDVTLPDVAGWGDYFRWIGAAAASVVVWEWVERIEALERDEKKDGILGREIFDGDEMIDMNPSEAMTYVPRRNDSYYPRSHGGSDDNDLEIKSESMISSFARRFGRKLDDESRNLSGTTQATKPFRNQETGGNARLAQAASGESSMPVSAITPPPNALSPPSRTDTTSAASTVYVIRHDGMADLPQPVRRRMNATLAPKVDQEAEDHEDQMENRHAKPSRHWNTVQNPFKRKRTTPPPEVRAAMTTSNDAIRPSSSRQSSNMKTKAALKGPKWQFASRIGDLASNLEGRTRNRDTAKTSEIDLPWTVIPAQPRGAAAWSPGFGEGGLLSSTPDTATSNNIASRTEGLRSATNTPLSRATPGIPEESEPASAIFDPSIPHTQGDILASSPSEAARRPDNVDLGSEDRDV